MKACVNALANLLISEPALYAKLFDSRSFKWFNLNHREDAVISFKRIGPAENDELLIILNMTPVERIDWKISIEGMPTNWIEIFNSDKVEFWGTGNYVNNIEKTLQIQKNVNKYEIKLSLPPLGGCIIKKCP